MAKSIPIRHNLIWANIYIVVGVFCTLFFSVGGYMLKDYQPFIYAVAAIGPIVIGFKMRKSNYALVSLKHIQVFGLLGHLREDYQLNGQSIFFIKSNRIFITNGTKLRKVKINNWFINQHDWKRALELFETNDFEKLTKHLIDD
jgi:hypothetical protein